MGLIGTPLFRRPLRPSSPQCKLLRPIWGLLGPTEACWGFGVGGVSFTGDSYPSYASNLGADHAKSLSLLLCRTPGKPECGRVLHANILNVGVLQSVTDESGVRPLGSWFVASRGVPQMTSLMALSYALLTPPKGFKHTKSRNASTQNHKNSS